MASVAVPEDRAGRGHVAASRPGARSGLRRAAVERDRDARLGRPARPGRWPPGSACRRRRGRSARPRARGGSRSRRCWPWPIVAKAAGSVPAPNRSVHPSRWSSPHEAGHCDRVVPAPQERAVDAGDWMSARGGVESTTNGTSSSGLVLREVGGHDVERGGPSASAESAREVAVGPPLDAPGELDGRAAGRRGVITYSARWRSVDRAADRRRRRHEARPSPAARPRSAGGVRSRTRRIVFSS